MSTRDSVEQLIALVREAKFLEAIETFYADDATMRENLDPPRRGLRALLDNERSVLGQVPDIRLERLESYLVDGDRAAIHWVFAFTDPRGNARRLDEVALQHWQNGKIVEERFFYDPAQRQRDI